MIKHHKRGHWIRIVVSLLLGALTCALLLSCVQGAAPSDGIRLGLTRDQMLEDYDALWHMLEENYPFLYVAQRGGIDVGALKERGREEMRSARDTYDYFAILYELLADMEYTGHLSMVDYMSYRDLFASFEGDGSALNRTLNDAWLKLMQNPKTQANYEILKMALELPDYESYQEADTQEFDAEKSEVEAKIILDGRVAYLRLPSFYRNIDNDHKFLLDFYAANADCEHLIIDIRDNGGGYSWYWEHNIVAPNIDAPLAFYDLQIYRDSKQNHPFIRAEIRQGAKSFPLDQLPDLPKLNPDDLKLADRFLRFDQSVTPASEDGKKLFQGKIWVLTGPRVYSAAEMFCYFCKQTGFATLVGEATGGDGPGVSPALYALPNSGLLVQYSCSHGLNPDGSSNEEAGTMPDIVIQPGEDALNVCIGEIVKREAEGDAASPAA